MKRTVLLAALLPAPVVFATMVGSDAELRAALAELKPGSVLRIKPGAYRPGLTVSNAHGSPGKPTKIA